jgi:hypothetical protein
VDGSYRYVDGRFFGSLEDLTNGYAIITAARDMIASVRVSNMIVQHPHLLVMSLTVQQ